MTLAGQHLSEFARWLDASSASRLSPCAHKRRAPRRSFLGMRKPVVERPDDMIAKGRYGELLPWDFNEPPTDDFNDQALCLFVSFDHAEGVKLGESADLGFAPGQPSAYARLLHVTHKLQDTADAAKAGHWRFKGDAFPLLTLVGVPAPDMPIGAACEASGVAWADSAVPVIATPLWRFSRKQQAELRALLPFIP